MDHAPLDGARMTPIRERALALVAERLAQQLPDVPVERARRAMVEDDEMPRLVVRGGDLSSSDGTAFGETTYGVGVIVVGYAKADPDAEDQDIACEQALSALHARVVKALAAWQPDGTDLNEVREAGGADFTAYDLDDNAAASGEFTAGFEAESIRPTGHPYAA
jgi:hypothetical protein